MNITGAEAQPSAFLAEQLIVDLLNLTVFHGERHVGEQVAPAGWHEVTFVAVRRRDWRTNDDANLGTRDVITRLRLWQPRSITSNLNNLDRLSDSGEADRRQLVLLAHQHVPPIGMAQALASFLPFDLTCFPDHGPEYWLDNQQTTRITNTTILLLLAWMISSKVSRYS